jgi:hypothetical protein
LVVRSSFSEAPPLFQFSGPFPSQRSARLQFADAFGGFCGLVGPENCSLVRLTISVDCFIARATSTVRLLLNARINRDIVLHRCCAALELAVGSGQFGTFSLFRRHFVITLHNDDISDVFRYMFAGYPNIVELFTSTAGPSSSSFLARPTSSAPSQRGHSAIARSVGSKGISQHLTI